MRKTGLLVTAARFGKSRQRKRVTMSAIGTSNSAFKIADPVGHDSLLLSVGHARRAGRPQKQVMPGLAVTRASRGAFVSLARCVFVLFLLLSLLTSCLVVLGL